MSQLKHDYVTTYLLKIYPPAYSAFSKVGPPPLYPLISGRWNITMTVQVIPNETVY